MNEGAIARKALPCKARRPIPWQPKARRARRRDEEIVAVRIAWDEPDLRERAKQLGAIRRPAQKLWEMRWIDAKRLGLSERIVSN